MFLQESDTHHFYVHFTGQSKSHGHIQLQDAVNCQPVLCPEEELAVGWAKYDLARIGTIRLVPTGSHLSQLEDDYKKMKDMIYGERPSFNELIDYIAILEKMINSN